jgi:hypothetical protein
VTGDDPEVEAGDCLVIATVGGLFDAVGGVETFDAGAYTVAAVVETVMGEIPERRDEMCAVGPPGAR